MHDAPMLTIRLTRLSPTHHRFAYARPDGSGEAAEIETKSLLVHDLVHYAFECEAGLAQSFYGLLASGHSLADLQPEGNAFPTEEARLTERIVGPLTGAMLGRVGVDEFLAAFRDFQKTSGESTPRWLTPDLVERAVTRFREVHGRWKATPFHATLELAFPPNPDPCRESKRPIGQSRLDRERNA